MTHPAPLSDAEVKTFLAAHPLWAHEGGGLIRTYEAPTFLRGIHFVEHVARVAEAADHHPDIDVRWKKVTLRFTTHDAGSRVTAHDARLASECDLLFDSLFAVKGP